MATTYLSRDPRQKIPFFTDSEDVSFTSTFAFMVACIVFLPLIVVSPWLAIGTPVSFVSYFCWALYKLHSGREKYVVAYGGLVPAARAFRENWFRLDDELQLELADIYHAVVRIVDAIHATESAEIRHKLNSEIERRTRAVSEVADEAELTRSQAVHDSVIVFDDHAFETARLYIESFQQQRGEGS